jgi:hypothetical protein
MVNTIKSGILRFIQKLYMKKLLFLAFAVSFAISAKAQFNYTFSKDTAVYAPLTSGISLNGNTKWDDESYMVPLGFTFTMDDSTTADIGINSMNFFSTDTMGMMNTFLVFTADMHDKGADTSTMSHSPIRYEITGTAPYRIAKIEVANAGFYDEYDQYSTADDSVSFQVWFYETSNIVEMHFGPSYMLHFEDYMYNDSGVVNMGYLKHLDWNNGNVENFYFLKGDTASALTIDSTNNLMNSLNEGMSAWPSNGAVYRFTPPTLSVKNAMAALKQVNVYPTAAQQELFIDNNSDNVVNYTILSLTGAAISNGNASNGKTKVDLSNLPVGSYLIQLSNGEIAKAMKFVKL